MISIPVGLADNGKSLHPNGSMPRCISLNVRNLGVPFSLGIIQTAWKEHLLVKFGSAIEDLLSGRETPGFHNLDTKNYMYVGVPPDANAAVERSTDAS